MRFMRPPIRVLLCFAVATVAACGDSTGPDGPEPNFVRLESDAGDWIGAGESYSYTQENASEVMLSLVRAMDIPAASVGEGEAEATDGLSEIEA